MIDKAELRIPPSARFQPEVQEFVREIPYAGYSANFRRSKRYQAVVDLRPLGIDALLHAFCKVGHRNCHKLELLDTGIKGYSELLRQVLSTFHDINPLELELMRVDLCADIVGTPVSWFQSHTRVKYKRMGREIGITKYEKLGRGQVETILAGSRPNVFRFYDKVAECKVQLAKLQRRQSADSEPLDLEKQFGFKSDDVVTRIERQFSGNGIPKGISTFGKLREAVDFNPFTPLQIVGIGSKAPTVARVGVDEYLKGSRLQELAEEMGMQQLRSWLNKYSSGNAARILEKYAPFFPSEGENALTQESVYAAYRNSIVKQLAT